MRTFLDYIPEDQENAPLPGRGRVLDFVPDPEPDDGLKQCRWCEHRSKPGPLAMHEHNIHTADYLKEKEAAGLLGMDDDDPEIVPQTGPLLDDDDDKVPGLDD